MRRIVMVKGGNMDWKEAAGILLRQQNELEERILEVQNEILLLKRELRQHTNDEDAHTL